MWNEYVSWEVEGSMISRRLKLIILLSLGLIYVHGLEEIITGFYLEDTTMKFFGRLFNLNGQDFYWISHMIWWAALPVLVYIVIRKRKMLWMLYPYGAVFFVELHHISKALLTKSYYPGMITAFFYPLMGIIYWKELLKNWKGNN